MIAWPVEKKIGPIQKTSETRVSLYVKRNCFLQELENLGPARLVLPL